MGTCIYEFITEACSIWPIKCIIIPPSTRGFGSLKQPLGSDLCGPTQEAVGLPNKITGGAPTVMIGP